eukprot:gene5927-5996_t
MLTAELFNWTGHVLVTPRTQIAQALVRPEASNAGIYLLLGEQDGQPLAYVGEGEDISARIRAHDAARDWWTSAVLVTAASNKLNKAYARYLEARLIAVARAIGSVPLQNGTNPPIPSLSEADIAKMEAFLENLFVVLPAVRVDMFIQRSRPAIVPAQPATAGALLQHSAAAPPALTARFELTTIKNGVKATAVLINGEFIVEAGSLVRQRWEGLNTAATGAAQLHAELLRSGVIVPDGALGRFTQNYVFGSPSSAASVVNGRPTNGTLEWKEVGSGVPYRDWEAKQLSVPPSQDT